MKTVLLGLCLLPLFTGLASAEIASPQAPATGVVLKTRSSFDANEARDPFWPIGWKKPETAHSDGPNSLPTSAFSLTSITMGAATRYAILNGRIMQEGQQFGLRIANKICLVTLKKIEDGQITLSYQQSDIIIPLRRK